jgi:hypothetical protein
MPKKAHARCAEKCGRRYFTAEGPKGEHRPADVNTRAVMIAKVATGEVDDAPKDDGKDPAAKALGAKGGAAS